MKTLRRLATAAAHLIPHPLLQGNAASAILLLTALVMTLSSWQYETCAWADTVYLVRSDATVTPVDTDNPGPHAMTGGEPIPMTKAGGIAFTVSYTDTQLHNGIGFDDPASGADRRARVVDILIYLNSVLHESGACDILFLESLHLGTETLASAGTYFDGTPGFTNGYAFEHITTGVAPSDSVPDIEGTVDFGWPWYQGTDTVPNDKVDLFSVLLHEMTHGLGLISVPNASGVSSIGSHVYTRWDSLLETGNGKTLFGGAPPSFKGVQNDLLGLANGIVFAGAQARAAYGNYPPIYAPNPFEEGSSLAHWDTTIQAVMGPSIGSGKSKRQYAPVDLGALQDIGYSAGTQEPPSAAFTANANSGDAPLTVQFTDQSTPGSDPISSWSWNFGDSATSTAQNPAHTYTGGGKYTVSLTVTTSVNAATETKVNYIHVTGALILTPVSGVGGSISPAVPVTLPLGGSQTFTIAPNANFHIADVLVDGVSVGAVTSYPFTNVTSSHTIDARFAINTFTLTPTAGAGGTISPDQPVQASYGSNRTFTMAAATGHHVADVLVDGVSVGAVNSYTFTNVTTAHTITAQFAVNTYTLTPTAGMGGTISPSTPVQATYNASRTFTITPDSGYQTASVSVDGIDAGTPTQYTFTNIGAAHTISATFAATPSGCVGGSSSNISNPPEHRGSLLLLGVTATILSALGGTRRTTGKLSNQVRS